MIYRTIVADPPWRAGRGPALHNGTGWPKTGDLRSLPLTYPTMSVDEIAALPVRDLAAHDAHLYLWTINAYVEQAYAVARAWGFRPSTLLVWAKTPNGLGLGGAYSITTEFCLFARRGTLRANERIDSTWWHWRRGRHSQKPGAFQEMVERVSPGPYLEMFARRPRDGWHVWGDEVDSDIDLAV